jgi:hypothetical protein
MVVSQKKYRYKLIMQFALEVAVLECSSLKHSHRILGVNKKKKTIVGNFVLCCKCCGFSHALLVFFYIHGFIHLQTIGLRCLINYESNPSSQKLRIILCTKLCESLIFGF